MPFVRRIAVDPDPILHKVAKKVTDLQLRMPVTQTLIDDMLATMAAAPGLGLAAPQVGIGKRIIVVGEIEERGPFVVINPVLSDLEGEAVAVEGCLSIPGKLADVKRASACTVRGFDRRGRKFRFKAEGLLARVFQHEVDHVDGVLITDKALRIYEPEVVEVAEAKSVAVDL